ncbi:hypothetical protein [Asaia sp. As-1742]|uniref:hypothetical protein n=1 Tax=Asaia sp. As-1742 TaxID=2608325 RepID=UPI00141E51D8|nr:hypothetical protein [Asaia sp. As-1742]NIE81279.1 hypothetical protein [Asaia sp. As-1742]
MEVSPRPSLSRLGQPSDDREPRGTSGLGTGGRSSGSGLAILRTAFWAVCYFAFYFAQQVAEVLAPLCLVLGIGWMALPKALSAITTGTASTDPQAQDVMNHVVGSIPDHLAIGSHVMTASGLVFDGFMLMAIAALGATVSAVAARNM